MRGVNFVITVPEALARPPLGLDFAPKDFSDTAFSDPEVACVEVLERAVGLCNETARSMHTQEGVGLVLEESPYCHFIERDGVWVVFAGEVSSWPGHDTVAEAHDAFIRGEEPAVHDDAEWLLDFYSSFSMHANASNITEAALDALSRVVGSFAFVVWDHTQRRVWAGRDSSGAQALYWGTTDDGQLVFGTDPAKMDGCNPSATPFPAGTLYASGGNTYAVNPGEEGWVIYGEQQAGTLLSFVYSTSPVPGHYWRDVKAIPRLMSNGVLCGAVYRVASEQQLGSIAGF